MRGGKNRCFHVQCCSSVKNKCFLFWPKFMCQCRTKHHSLFVVFTFASDKCHKDLRENRNHNTKQKRKKKMWRSPDEMCSLLSRRPLAAAITSAAGSHWVSLKINERRCFSRHSGLDNLHPYVCLRSLLISWREVISHAALPLCLRGRAAASWHSASLSGSGGHRRH